MGMTNEEAIKIIKQFRDRQGNSSDDIEALDKAIKALEQEPKTGHWIYIPERRLDDETDEGRIYITDYRCTCSECNSDFGFQKMSDAYCKYCGAKMEVSE